MTTNAPKRPINEGNNVTRFDGKNVIHAGKNTNPNERSSKPTVPLPPPPPPKK